MAREVNLHALGQQALATPLTATGKNRATALGFHAGAEPELLLAGAFGRLVGAFHKPGNSFGKRAETVAAPPPMSTGSLGDFALRRAVTRFLPAQITFPHLRVFPQLCRIIRKEDAARLHHIPVV